MQIHNPLKQLFQATALHLNWSAGYSHDKKPNQDLILLCLLKQECFSKSLTCISCSFSLKIGRLSLCSMMESWVFLPYEALLPPNACFFHSGISLGIIPIPRMFAAICLPSTRKEIIWSLHLGSHSRDPDDPAAVIHHPCILYLWI